MSMEELNLAELGEAQLAKVVVEVDGEIESRTHSFMVINPGEKPECAMHLAQPDGSLHFEKSVRLEGSIPPGEIDRTKALGVLKAGELAVIQGLDDRYGRTTIMHPIKYIRIHKKT